MKQLILFSALATVSSLYSQYTLVPMGIKTTRVKLQIDPTAINHTFLLDEYFRIYIIQIINNKKRFLKTGQTFFPTPGDSLRVIGSLIHLTDGRVTNIHTLYMPTPTVFNSKL